jgi:hypothetical protein
MRSCALAKSACSDNFFKVVMATSPVTPSSAHGLDRQRVKEGVDHPGDEHTVVDNEHPTTRHWRHQL